MGMRKILNKLLRQFLKDVYKSKEVQLKILSEVDNNEPTEETTYNCTESQTNS